MGSLKTMKVFTILLLVTWAFSLAGNSMFLGVPLGPVENPSSFQVTPPGLNAQLVYPNIGKAAFALNGSQVEVQIRGSDNITSWDFTLFREYQSYSLSHDTPSYNVTTGSWFVNISIPTDSAWDLYDLQVTVSDGLTQLDLEEWNAIQVRHSFPENFTIFQFTDTHFFSGSGAFLTKLRAAQYQAALANADLIITTGDLTDDGGIGSYNHLKNVMRESRVPYLILPGNHDRDSTGPSFNTYMSIFGSDYYTANIGPDIFIIMTNTYQTTGERYRFNFTQLAWIENDLAASNAKTKIVCGHAPMYQPDEDEFFMQYDEAIELQRIAREQNMTVYLGGHRHNDRVDLVNGTYFIGTTSLGGSVWSLPTDPGHHRNGLRKLMFTKNNLTSWSWTNWNWSQPWDEVQILRQPSDFHIQELGGYISIQNNLTTPLTDQIIDFIVEPLSGLNFYLVDGGSVVFTVNGSSSWFIRATVDIPVDGVVVVSIYPSITQAPNIGEINYPNPGFVGAISSVVAEVTNPISGVRWVDLNLSINSAPYTLIRMGLIGNDQFRYYSFFASRSTLEFYIIATDYSGQTTASSFHSFVVTNRPGPPILSNPGLVSETGNVSLSWTASTDDDGTIEYYSVQASDAEDFANILHETNVTTTSTTIYGLTNNTYYFRVQAVDNDNAASIWSNTENITVAIPPPTTPPPPPPPINWPLIGIIAGGAGITIIVIGVVVYFVRVRPRKTE